MRRVCRCTGVVAARHTFHGRSRRGEAGDRRSGGHRARCAEGDIKAGANASRDDLAGERFYFVMPDRYANGDPRNDRAGARRGARIRPDGQAVLPRWRPGRALLEGGLPGRPRREGAVGEPDRSAIAGWSTSARWARSRRTTAMRSPTSPASTRTSVRRRRCVRWSTRRMPAASRCSSTSPRSYTADVITFAGEHPYKSLQEAPYKDANGKAVRHRGDGRAAGLPEALCRQILSVQPVLTPEAAKLKKPDWLNDPTLYHNRGDSTFSGEQCSTGDFFGLDDLMTEHPKVVNGMKEIFTAGSTARHRRLPGRHGQARQRSSSGRRSRRAMQAHAKRQEGLLRVRRGLQRRRR